MLRQKIGKAQKAETERRFENALEVYEQMLDKDASTPDARRMVLKKRAELYEQINQADKAESDFSAALKVDPIDPRAFADRGYFYLRRNRYSDALDDFIAGSRLERGNPLFQRGAARARMAAGDFAGAVKFYDEALALAPNDPSLLVQRAEAYVHRQAWDAAKADYEKAIAVGVRTRNDRFFAYSGLGYVSLQMGSVDIALQNLDRALEIDPDAANVLLWRGRAHERRGEHDQALRDYERLLELTPDSIPARDSLRRLRSVSNTPTVTPR